METKSLIIVDFDKSFQILSDLNSYKLIVLKAFLKANFEDLMSKYYRLHDPIHYETQFQNSEKVQVLI